MTTVGNRVRLGLAGPQPLAAEITRLSADRARAARGHARHRQLEGGRDPPRGDLGARIRLRLTVDRYDPKTDRAQVAAHLGGRAHLGGLERARPTGRRPMCSRCCRTPAGEPHIGHLKNYAVGDAVAHFHRRRGDLRAPPDGLRRLRPARREPRDQDRPAPARSPRTSRSPRSGGRCASGGSRSTGRASSARTSPSTTAGPSGSSCACTSAASPTARRRRSSGARRTRPCSPTSR